MIGRSNKENPMDNQNSLYVTHKQGMYHFNRAVTEKELLDAAEVALTKQASKNAEFFENSETAKRYFRLKIAHYTREVFACAFLNTKHQLIKFEVMFMGTIDSSYVYPREVVRRVLELNAATLIVGHNHPSGHVVPSQSDILITDSLKEALGTVDTRLLDHVIVGHLEEAYSFADAGKL